ncbi:MAG TPA: DASS family sodium-coupled anion symporter [Planctomycetota bacterium]|nr:DASS family sodium-coupled anion symporter [Planctomycetota bacterium]
MDADELSTAETLAPAARRWVRGAGLAAGPLLALALHRLLPDAFTGAAGDPRALPDEARSALALMAWMATWWLTGAVDISATALLPLVLLPFLGAATIEDAAQPYASPVIFLFLGGFLMARAMQRWQLDRRIALLVLRRAGTRPDFLIGAFMVTAATLSAFVSNTATVAMMYPIGLSVVALLESRRDANGNGDRTFALVLMLAIAYASSIGGLATIIGSPPNGLLVQYARDHLGHEITFLGWLAIGLPVSAVLLPFTWWWLVRIAHPVSRERIPGGEERIAADLRALGAVKPGEWATFLVFCAAVLCWVTRPWLARAVPGISDAGIAVAAGLALLALPLDRRLTTFALDWRTAAGLPWGVLILFGGGLSLAGAIDRTGAAEFLGTQASALTGLPPLAFILLVTSGMIFLTELTSNTATAATMVPILAALAAPAGLPPLALVVPVTLAASCAFMLPVATPPNAIVFGSGRVTIPQMARAGVTLNLVAVLVITALVYALVL